MYFLTIEIENSNLLFEGGKQYINSITSLNSELTLGDQVQFFSTLQGDIQTVVKAPYQFYVTDNHLFVDAFTLELSHGQYSFDDISINNSGRITHVLPGEVEPLNSVYRGITLNIQNKLYIDENSSIDVSKKGFAVELSSDYTAFSNHGGSYGGTGGSLDSSTLITSRY